MEDLEHLIANLMVILKIWITKMYCICNIFIISSAIE